MAKLSKKQINQVLKEFAVEVALHPHLVALNPESVGPKPTESKSVVKE
jgi:hypothetical protein